MITVCWNDFPFNVRMNLLLKYHYQQPDPGKSVIEIILDTEKCTKSTTETNGMTHLIFTDEDYLLFVTKWA